MTFFSVASFPAHFDAPKALAIALILLFGGAVIALWRRPAIAGWPITFFTAGAAFIALAAGEPVVEHPAAGSITVMVDLSPSTRGASFRDRPALDTRLGQLLRDHPYRLVAFADSIQPIPQGQQLGDIPVDRTLFAPPASDAVVLFSDGQFILPTTAPQTYPVIDPALDQAGDAAVSQLVSSGPSVIASVDNTGGSRSLQWTHATPLTPAAASGSFQQYAKPHGTGEISASLSPGDRWPENDSLSIRPVTDFLAQRWWVGDGAPAGWRTTDLPSEPVDYLQTSAIVLRNIPVDALSTDQQQRLVEYVRDLGGSLTIVGGDHAFASGGYDASALDSLSPLASSPPQPTTHWVLLIDGSGSMAGTGGAGATPWQIECAAVAGLLAKLPADDPVSVGSFAEALSWWTNGKSEEETARLHLPPPSAFPNGPTNLAPVLKEITARADGSSVTELLVMTDADTELPGADQLSAEMVRKKIHLHVLATGRGSALPALRSIATTTGGSVVEQLDPPQWVAASQVLLKQALPRRYQHEPVTVQFAGNPTKPQMISEWNQTWLRNNASRLAGAGDTTMAAHWRVGLGGVTAIAFPADSATITALSAPFESQPRDPRFAVMCEQNTECKITLNAVDRGDFLNHLKMRVELRDGGEIGRIGETYSMTQTGPGRYELTLPAARRPRIVTVFNGSQPIDRFAVAARYAPEFDHIGNNAAALEELARRTGGTVVPAGSITPIDFHWPVRSTSIAPGLAVAGFLALGAGLVLDRRSNLS